MSPRSSGPTRRTHEERREDSAERLREALVELICEQGYSATTNAQIGERAGFSRNMVRDRYGSKDALLLDLVGQTFETFVPEERTPDEDGRARAARIVDLIRHLAETAPSLHRALNIVLLEGAAGSDPAALATRAAVVRLSEVMAEALAGGVADGSVSADVDLEVELVLVRTRLAGLAFLDAAGLLAGPTADRIDGVRAAFDARLAPTGDVDGPG
ncbi:MAG TPA: TetR/AcrR family transcriptional regulator [Aquihabitans sp.]|nr:TetR/AcrR family transcriptional regulator [Aquihabitans sp.]